MRNAFYRIDVEEIMRFDFYPGKRTKKLHECPGIVIHARKKDSLAEYRYGIALKSAACLHCLRREFARMVEVRHEPYFLRLAQSARKRSTYAFRLESQRAGAYPDSLDGLQGSDSFNYLQQPFRRNREGVAAGKQDILYFSVRGEIFYDFTKLGIRYDVRFFLPKALPEAETAMRETGVCREYYC